MTDCTVIHSYVSNSIKMKLDERVEINFNFVTKTIYFSSFCADISILNLHSHARLCINVDLASWSELDRQWSLIRTNVGGTSNIWDDDSVSISKGKGNLDSSSRSACPKVLIDNPMLGESSALLQIANKHGDVLTSCDLYASGDAMVLVIIYAEPMFAAALSFVHLPPRKDSEL